MAVSTGGTAFRSVASLALVLALAAAPDLTLAQSRPTQSPPDSGGSSDVDTARAVLGVLGFAAKKAREAAAKKKEEAARKQREEEAAAQQAAADAAATPPVAEPTGRPAEPEATVSGTIARTSRPSIPPKPKPIEPAARKPTPTPAPEPPPVVVAEPVPAPPPPVVAPAPPVLTAAPLPPPPVPPSTPWGALALGVLVLLAVLGAAAAMAVRQAMGWGAPPPHARTWADPGEAAAPVFARPFKGPLISLSIGRGAFASEVLYPEAAGSAP